MKWENHFLVFDISKGPKVIIESLDTYGQEGWECSTMVTVAGTNLVAFLKRRIDVEEVPKDEKAEKLAKMWSSENKSGK
tara:strand:- start:205 stop:441 length:237 start_codon:yes stop_codon:yes gene_type:complete